MNRTELLQRIRAVPAQRVRVLASVVAVARAVRMAVRPGGPSIGERAGAVPRMVRATLSGDYVGVSKGRLLMMLAAAAGSAIEVCAAGPDAEAAVEALAHLVESGFDET